MPTREHRRLWAAEILARVPESSRGAHSYSNHNYVVAGAMFEELTGELWEDLMQRAVFEPLRMTSTGFGAPGTVGEVPDEPRGHTRRDGEWVAYQPVVTADNSPVLGPAGTAHTTLLDFARYMAAHLAGARLLVAAPGRFLLARCTHLELLRVTFAIVDVKFGPGGAILVSHGLTWNGQCVGNLRSVWRDGDRTDRLQVCDVPGAQPTSRGAGSAKYNDQPGAPCEGEMFVHGWISSVTTRHSKQGRGV